jgi:oligopeptide transport system substrate-binding protein
MLPRRVRRAGQASLVALSAVLAAACTTGSADSPYFGKAQPPAGQVLRYISGSEPESLDPPMASGQPEARIMMALFDGLTEYDPKTAQPIPALAERWEPNEDNSVFTFYLRDAKWSDGSPITADDFVYSLHRGLTPSLASRIAYMAYDISYAQAYNEAAVFIRDRATGSFVMTPANPSERLTLPGDEAARAEALKAPALAMARDKEYVPVRAEDVGIEAVRRAHAPLPHAAAGSVRAETGQPPVLSPCAAQDGRAVRRQVDTTWPESSSAAPSPSRPGVRTTCSS